MENKLQLEIWPTCAMPGCSNLPMRGRKQPYCLACHARYQRAWWQNLKADRSEAEIASPWDPNHDQ